MGGILLPGLWPLPHLPPWFACIRWLWLQCGRVILATYLREGPQRWCTNSSSSEPSYGYCWDAGVWVERDGRRSNESIFQTYKLRHWAHPCGVLVRVNISHGVRFWVTLPLKLVLCIYFMTCMQTPSKFTVAQIFYDITKIAGPFG